MTAFNLDDHQRIWFQSQIEAISFQLALGGRRKGRRRV